MNSHYYLGFTLLFVLLCSNWTFAQSGLDLSTLSGKVVLEDELVIGATIQIQSLNKSAITDINGEFKLEQIPIGTYELIVSYVGAQAFSQEIDLRKKEEQIVIELELDANVLSGVTVSAKSKSAEIKALPITISSLDAKAYRSQSLGAEELLKRSSGVVVRQQGGLGSQTSINLNGLTGSAVRIYYDGIPVDVYGGGIQLNNIPVEALDRIDVYKGVMPIDVGTDALGGGINLVPYQSFKEYLSSSYSVGSFNTHRFTLGGRKNLSDQFSLSALSYVNYSDNDYAMENIPNLEEVVQDNGAVFLREEFINTKRFHNQHFSAFGEVQATFSNLSWADRLSFASSISHRMDEIQHGQTIQNVAIGEAERSITSISQKVDYRKKLFDDRLDLRYFGLVSYTISENQDSTRNVYNWRGELLQSINNSTGSEIFAFPSMRRGENLGTAHRFIASYSLSDQLTFTVSDFFRYSSIEGNDPIGPRLFIGEQAIDPNTVPSTLTRNIFGAELKSTLFAQKLTAITFLKHYYYRASSIDILQRNATILPVRDLTEDQFGYGLALKYKLTNTLFVRGSYEQTTRIPTEGEIFGDFAAILPNYTLKPENSDNWNMGFSWDKPLASNRFFSFQADGFIRNQRNLIRLEPFGPENAMFINEAEVEGYGFELATKIIPIERLTLSANFTWQSNEIVNTSLSVGIPEGSQVPNIPRLFYNTRVDYQIPQIFNTSFDISLHWDYFFIDRFSINEVQDLDTANPAFIIPQQHLHNAGIVFYPTKSDFKFSFTVRNLLDRAIFDNFRIPRPGINYMFKINYSI